MRFHRFALLVACLACADFARARVAQHPFTYSIPDGWTDLSPGVPESNFDNLHPDIVTEARSGKFVTFAVDFRDEDGYYEGMNALVRKGALTADDTLGLIPELQEAYEKEFGATVQVVDSGQVNIGTVRAVRVVFDISYPQLSLRQMQYFMPGGQDWYTIVTYSTVPEQYDRYRTIFEASANGTGGLTEAKAGFSIANVEQYFTELASSFVIFIVIALVIQQSMKKKQPPPRRGMPPRRR